MKKIIFILVLFFCLINFGLTKIEEKEINLTKVDTPPKIDGKIDDRCWQNKIELENFTKEEIKEKTTVFIVYTEKNLYFAFECLESQIEDLIKNKLIRDGEVEEDDCIKILLNPYKENETVYQFIINAEGTVLDKRGILGKEEEIGWNAKIEIATYINEKEKKWSVEISIPFEELEINPYVSSIWGINLLRIRQAKKHSPYEVSILAKTEELTKIGLAKLKEFKVNFGWYTRANMIEKIRLLKTTLTDDKLKKSAEELGNEIELLEDEVSQEECLPLWNKLEKLLKVSKKEKIIGWQRKEYITPHIKWANPYYQGKIKALFILPEVCQREVLELNQRLSLEYEIVAPYDKKLPTLLKEKEYETIIIFRLGGNLISNENQKLIAEKVKNGTGLIYLNPYQTEASLGALLPVLKVGQTKEAGSWQKNTEHFIVAGIPFEIFPKTSYVAYKTSNKVLVKIDEKPIIIISEDTVGQGRVVIFTYNDKESYGLLPTPAEKVSFPYWEYYYSLINKAILWTSRKVPIVTIEEIKPTQSNLSLEKTEKIKIDLNLKNYAELFKGVVYFILKDTQGNEESIRIEKIKMSQGKGKLTIEVPFVPKCGLHFIDVLIKQNEKIVNWGTTVFMVKRDYEIEKIRLEKEIYQVGEVLKGEIILKKLPLKKPAFLNISLKDAYNREVTFTSYPVKEEQTLLNFSLKVENTESLLNKIEVSLYDEKNILHHRLDKEFLVPKEKSFDDYKIIMWSSDQYNRLPEYLRPYYFKRFIEIGCDAGMNYQGKFDLTSFLEHNLGFFIENVAHIGLGGFNSTTMSKKYYEKLASEYTEDKDTLFLVREPCLSDSANLDKIKERIDELVNTKSKYRPLFYSIGDENSITYLTHTFDFCFSPYCLQRFRTWLKEEYQTIEKLNEEWNTNFSEWEKVMPYTYEKILKREKNEKYPNYSPWADHRTFMEYLFAETIITFKKYIQEKDPLAKVGILGGQKPSCYGGYNWWRLMKVLDVVEAYPTGLTKEIIRSFNKENKCFILSSEFGEEGSREDSIRFYNLLNQDKGLILFSDPQYINFDLGLEKGAELSLNTYKELKSGMAKLLYNVKLKKSEIAIHYSQDSIHALWIEEPILPGKFPPRESAFDNARIGVAKIIEDLGLQYDFISYEEIEKGKLQDYKILILPLSVAISYKEAQAIEEFVKKGGLVIADFKIAQMDEHCKTQATGLLDYLFGIKRGEKKIPIFKEEKKVEEKEGKEEEKKKEESLFSEEEKNSSVPKEEFKSSLPKNYGRDSFKPKTPFDENSPPSYPTDFTSPAEKEKKVENTDISKVIKIIENYENLKFKEQVLPLKAEEYNLEISTGKILGDFGGIPCLIVNQLELGKTLYLNFKFSTYKELRHSSEEKTLKIREIFKEFFKLVGIENKIKILQYHNTIPNCRILTYEEGEAKYLAILKDYFFCKEQDKLGNFRFVPNDKNLSTGLNNVKIELEKEAYVYDIREKKFCGQTNTITTNFDLSGVKIYALMPYELKEIKFETKNSYKQGEEIEYEIRLVPSKGKILTHVINLEVLNPAGEKCLYYSKNLLVKNGYYKDKFLWAFNDQTGIWKFKLYDVATGREITKGIEVK